jgi:hypothetical protein
MKTQTLAALNETIDLRAKCCLSSRPNRLGDSVEKKVRTLARRTQSYLWYTFQTQRTLSLILDICKDNFSRSLCLLCRFAPFWWSVIPVESVRGPKAIQWSQFLYPLHQRKRRLGDVVVSVLATGPKGCEFQPGQGDGFLRAIKIRSTPSFGYKHVSHKPVAWCSVLISVNVLYVI